jgi:hypothetical protein
MRSLLVTSISAGAPDGDRLAGTVVMLDAGVAGMAERRLAGTASINAVGRVWRESHNRLVPEVAP